MAYVGTVPATTVTTATNQSNIVVQSPYPPGYYPHYASKSSIVLGGTQITAGIVVIILSIIALATYGPMGAVGDIFCGVLVSNVNITLLNVSAAFIII